MDAFRRKTVLSLLALPAGCGLQPLAPLQTQTIVGPTNPVHMRPPALGQSWTYQKFNIYNGEVVAIEREEVISLSPRIVLERTTQAGMQLAQEHHLQWGQLLREPHWDFTQNYVDAIPLWPQELVVGASSQIRTDYRMDNFSYPFWIRVQTVAKRWEKITLPALGLGEFNALHIERLIGLQHQDFSRTSTTRWEHLWLVPEIGRWVARQLSGEYTTSGRRGGGSEDHFRWELTAWR
jgi:hypothetical protein